jgi:magnesium-transporting ATPase (P-type)
MRKWPFAKAQQRSAALVRLESGAGRFYATGPVKRLLQSSSRLLLPDGSTKALTSDQRTALDHVVFSLPHVSLNAVALAYRDVARPEVFCQGQGGTCVDPLDMDAWLGNLDEHGHLLTEDMVFVGLLAFKNEVRGDVPEAVAACEALGAKVRIVTGESMEGGKGVALACGLLPAGAVSPCDCL